MAVRQTRGRQKIAMKYIEDDESRLISFSKRKSGILKKASEIANLCGAEVGLVFTTPAGKPFSFAHPSIEAITDRFLNRQSFDAMNPSLPFMQARQRQRVKTLNDSHNEWMQRAMAAKEKRKSLRQMREAIRKGNERDNVPPGWWEVATEDVEAEEMDRVAEEMEKFLEDVTPFTTPQKALPWKMMMMMVDHHGHGEVTRVGGGQAIMSSTFNNFHGQNNFS